MADEHGKAEGFLSRWSRRKREIEEAEAAVEIAPDDQELTADAGAPDLEAEQNRLAAEAVDIDSLGRGDDFSVFLKRGVPELLRKQALRRLWRTDPVFANLDGLNDYDEDFRNPAHNAYASLWRAGRGFLSADEQETQQATGGISREVAIEEPAGGEMEPAEEVSEAEPESLATDEAAAASPDEKEPPQTMPIEADNAAEPAFEPAQSIEQEEVEQPRRRVSLRSRLEG